MSLPARQADPARSLRRRCAVFIGQSERPLVELLSDVLADVDVSVHLDVTSGGHGPHDAQPSAPPDMVLVMVDRNDFAGLFGRAHAIAAGAPILAILPFHDERMVRRSVAHGANACYSLDRPIAQLKSDFFVLQRDLP